MFAILLNKGMDPFYQNIASFPTAFFTFFLAICTLYWLLAVFGVVDLDILDIEGTEADFDFTNEGSTANALAGVMLKFGLHGIPVTIIVSFLSLFGWLFSYYTIHYLSPFVPSGIFYFLFSLFVLIIAFWFAVLLTAMIVRLLIPLFKNATQQTNYRYVGHRVTIRSSKVTDSFGEAFLQVDGAELILKVRADKGKTFRKGDEVILLEYLHNDNLYRVISEQDFNI